MIVILATTFAGITFLAHQFGVVPLPPDYAGGYETVVSQIARTTFGGTNAAYYYLQFATLAILILAANTAYSDFPGSPTSSRAMAICRVSSPFAATASPSRPGSSPSVSSRRLC